MVEINHTTHEHIRKLLVENNFYDLLDNKTVLDDRGIFISTYTFKNKHNKEISIHGEVPRRNINENLKEFGMNDNMITDILGNAVINEFSHCLIEVKLNNNDIWNGDIIWDASNFVMGDDENIIDISFGNLDYSFYLYIKKDLEIGELHKLLSSSVQQKLDILVPSFLKLSQL